MPLRFRLFIISFIAIFLLSACEKEERIAEAKKDPYLSGLLAQFPGAEVLDVLTPEPDEDGEENIVHVDFSPPQKTRKEGR